MLARLALAFALFCSASRAFALEHDNAVQYVGGIDVELSGGNPHLHSAALMAYTAWILRRTKKNAIPFFSVDLRF